MIAQNSDLLNNILRKCIRSRVAKLISASSWRDIETWTPVPEYFVWIGFCRVFLDCKKSRLANHQNWSLRKHCFFELQNAQFLRNDQFGRFTRGIFCNREKRDKARSKLKLRLKVCADSAQTLRRLSQTQTPIILRLKRNLSIYAVHNTNRTMSWSITSGREPAILRSWMRNSFSKMLPERS